MTARLKEWTISPGRYAVQPAALLTQINALRSKAGAEAALMAEDAHVPVYELPKEATPKSSRPFRILHALGTFALEWAALILGIAASIVLMKLRGAGSTKAQVGFIMVLAKLAGDLMAKRRPDLGISSTITGSLLYLASVFVIPFGRAGAPQLGGLLGVEAVGVVLLMHLGIWRARRHR